MVSTFTSKATYCGFESVSGWIVFHIVQLDLGPTKLNGTSSADKINDSIGMVLTYLLVNFTTKVNSLTYNARKVCKELKRCNF